MELNENPEAVRGWFLTPRVKNTPLCPLVDPRGIPYVFYKREDVDQQANNENWTWMAYDNKKAIRIDHLYNPSGVQESDFGLMPENLIMAFKWMSANQKFGKVSVFESTASLRMQQISGNWKVSSRENITEAITQAPWGNKIFVSIKEFPSGFAVTVKEETKRSIGFDFFWTLPEALGRTASIMEAVTNLRTSKSLDRTVMTFFTPTVIHEGIHEFCNELLNEFGDTRSILSNKMLEEVVDQAYLISNSSFMNSSKRKLAKEAFYVCAKDASRPRDMEGCIPESADDHWTWTSPIGFHWIWPKTSDNAFEDLEKWNGMLICEKNNTENELILENTSSYIIQKRYVDRLNSVLVSSGYESRFKENKEKIVIEAAPGEGSNVRNLAKSLGLKVIRPETYGRLMTFELENVSSSDTIHYEYSIPVLDKKISEETSIRKGSFLIEASTGRNISKTDLISRT